MNKRIREATPLTIGIDLGDRRSSVFVLDASGAELARLSVATTAEALTQALGRYPRSRAVLEVGTHSPWVSRLLTQLGHEAVVANPRRVRAIAAATDKSDEIDAELLARLGRADVRLLRPIQHRGEAAQRDRALLGARDGLVRARTLLINQARGLAKALGQRLPRCTTKGFASKLEREGLSQTFPGLAALRASIAVLTEQIEELQTQIEALCAKRYPETERLRQVKGVGALTALAYVLTLEDPTRFGRSRSVGSYLGLRPRRRQSGGEDPQLRITKAGDPFLRRLLVQSAHYILGPFGPDTDLRRFGLRLVARGGRGAAKKARIAVARKLAVLLHRLWQSEQVYEPLRAAALTRAA